MTSEALVRKIIGTDGAEALISIVGGAWDDYVAEGRVRVHASTRAAIVWDYMAQRSDELLTEMDGVTRVLRHERPMYILRDRLILRPKKHTKDASTQNYPTGAQRTAVVLGMFPEYDYQVISFGYRLDAAEAGIQDCMITSPSDGWLINAQELADGELSPPTVMLPGMEEDIGDIEPIQRRKSS